MHNLSVLFISIIFAFASIASDSLVNNRLFIGFESSGFYEIGDEHFDQGFTHTYYLTVDKLNMNSHPAVIKSDTGVNDFGRVTSHYYVSLCFRGLKRLGFAGPESTGEDESFAEELAEVGEAFAFKPPMAGGPIFAIAYQIPGYLDPQTPDEMFKIFDSVKQMVESGTIQQLQYKFPDKTAEFEKWYIEAGLDLFIEPLQADKDKVYWLLDQFADYLEQLWPQYETEYSNWYEEFDFDHWNSQLPVEEVISVWEQVMEISYPYQKFSMVVCPETPSKASSLGPEKIVFGARHGLKQAKKSLVHEVGVRMVCFQRLAEHPKTAELIINDYVGIIKLLEAEACYRKPQVMDKLGWEYQADEDTFLIGMELEELVKLRAEICDDGPIFETIATWYSKAKEDGLL